MESPQLEHAVEAGRSLATALGLPVESAEIVHNSNRIAVHLAPCDVLVRIAPPPYRVGLQREVDIALSLARTNAPVALLDPRVEPRVYVRHGFVATLWSYHAPTSPSDVAPDEYARVLRQMHVAMKAIEGPVQHFTDRVEDAQRSVGDSDCSPDLATADRSLLAATLEQMTLAVGRRNPDEQLLHGEPHAGNLLRTRDGLLFVDLETCCRGPIEFDVAHVPDEVANQYPGLDQQLLQTCRVLMIAMIAAWRWRDDDDFPDRPYWRIECLSQLRAALDQHGAEVTGGRP